VTGKVKLYVASPSGQEKVIELIAPSQSFAEAFMFMDMACMVNAQALTDSLLLRVGKAVVVGEIQRDPQLAIRREIKQHGVKFILLDYLQLVEVKGGKKDTRTDQDIGAVSKMLKEVAIQHGLHVVALCAESDDGKIRNSREPEYDFDNILKLIVRNEKNPRTGNPMIVTDKVLCSKWRDAERGYTIRVEMEGKHCLFRDVTGPNA